MVIPAYNEADTLPLLRGRMTAVMDALHAYDFELVLVDDHSADATPEQYHFIHFLFGRLGWAGEPERVRGFLMKFAGVPAVEQIRDRKRAGAIIEALKAIERRGRATGVASSGTGVAPPGASR